jgi:hypothetical protein
MRVASRKLCDHQFGASEETTLVQADRAIGEQVARAAGDTVSNMGLRFDRVVVRTLGNLRAYVNDRVSVGRTVVLTLTAPIKMPARTVAALQSEIDALLRAGAAKGDRVGTVFGNSFRLRLAKHNSSRNHAIIGLVHNRDIDSKRLADSAQQWLRTDT